MHAADAEQGNAPAPPRRGGFFFSSYSRLFSAPPQPPPSSSSSSEAAEPSPPRWRSPRSADDQLHAPINPPSDETDTLPPPPPPPPAGAVADAPLDPQPAREATAAEPRPDAAAADATAEQDLRATLGKLMVACKAMAFLTLWQLLSASRIERITLLALMALLVPWAGYEGAKERNRALLSVFRSLCWLYIPLNIFHAYIHAEEAQSLLQGSLSESERSEVKASSSAFLGVTVLLMADMVLCIYWTRRVMQAHLLLILTQHEAALNEFVAAHQATHGGTTAGLPAGDLALLPVTAVEQVDPNKDVCVICQDDVNPGEVVRKLPCAHEFHAPCVDQWFERSSLCPICNANVHVLLVQAHVAGDIV